MSQSGMSQHAAIICCSDAEELRGAAFHDGSGLGGQSRMGDLGHTDDARTRVIRHRVTWVTSASLALATRRRRV